MLFIKKSFFIRASVSLPIFMKLPLTLILSSYLSKSLLISGIAPGEVVIVLSAFGFIDKRLILF